MKKPQYKPLPKHVTMRVGNKVMWLYFRTKEEADKAVPIAQHNAEVALNEGYDFGYMWPGTVRKMDDHYEGEFAQYAGLWEVCFP